VATSQRRSRTSRRCWRGHPGANSARDAVSRVRPADRGVGQTGRRDLRAEGAHAARGRQECRGTLARPGQRLGARAGIRRRTHRRDRRSAGAEARRWRDCSPPGAATRYGSRR
jgi:hypothetical protein